MPITFFRCKICGREFSGIDDAECCEREHLTADLAMIKLYGIHKYPYSIDVTFSNGETREYVAYDMG